MPQSRQRNWHLLFVTAAHAVGNDIYSVSRLEQIKGSLCDAYMALDADDDARQWTGEVERVESLLDLWCSVQSQQGRLLHILTLFSMVVRIYIMENSVLSKWHTVGMPPGASRRSSGHVSPSRALFCVVANTGMSRIWPVYPYEHTRPPG